MTTKTTNNSTVSRTLAADTSGELAAENSSCATATEQRSYAKGGPLTTKLPKPPNLHCPFCSGSALMRKRKAVTSIQKKFLFKVKCIKCGCQTDEADHPKQAWKFWNSRVVEGFIPEATP